MNACVSGKYFMNFEIPTEFTYLWRYMLHMYQLDAFTQSCPADQDIINHYKLQQVSKYDTFSRTSAYHYSATRIDLQTVLASRWQF